MSIPPAAAVLGAVAITPPEFLRHLKFRGRLQPLLQEAIVEQFLLQQAAKEGQAVSQEELQRAADCMRRRKGLTSAEQTRAWLAQMNLSVIEFEAALERDLLLDKLKDHICKDRIATHFERHRREYDRLLLRSLTVPREDLARELRDEIRDEGRDFVELIREQTTQTSNGESTGLALRFRRQLFPALAAALPATTEEVVGPVATPQGFVLLRLERIQSAELDAATRQAIRQELFDAWLQDQLAKLPMRFPLLDELK